MQKFYGIVRPKWGPPLGSIWIIAFNHLQIKIFGASYALETHLIDMSQKKETWSMLGENITGQIILFHQPGFSCNKRGFPLLFTTIWGLEVLWACYNFDQKTSTILFCRKRPDLPLNPPHAERYSSPSRQTYFLHASVMQHSNIGRFPPRTEAQVSHWVFEENGLQI